MKRSEKLREALDAIWTEIAAEVDALGVTDIRISSRFDSDGEVRIRLNRERFVRPDRMPRAG